MKTQFHHIEPALRRILRANRIVGLFYTLDDVEVVRPDLTPQQAWKVLHAVDKSLDKVHEFGMSHDAIKHFADELYPKAKDGDDT